MELSPSRYSPRIALPATRLFESCTSDCSNSRASRVSTPQSASAALARIRGSVSARRCRTHLGLRLPRPIMSTAFERICGLACRNSRTRNGKMRAPSEIMARISISRATARFRCRPPPSSAQSARVRASAISIPRVDAESRAGDGQRLFFADTGIGQRPQQQAAADQHADHVLRAARFHIGLRGCGSRIAETGPGRRPEAAGSAASTGRRPGPGSGRSACRSGRSGAVESPNPPSAR